jgi:hypothetical protein
LHQEGIRYEIYLSKIKKNARELLTF